MQIWFTILASWPEPLSPKQRERPGKGHGHRFDRFKGSGVSTAHHGEHAVLCAGLSTGHRGVDELQAPRLATALELACHVGRSGGVVDEDRAGASCPQRRHLRPDVTLRRSCIVADAAEHDVGVLRCLTRGSCVRWAPIGCWRPQILRTMLLIW